MQYTVKDLARLSEVSIRTLHYYDEIGLLKPICYGQNGYRYYGEPELLRLQQILFFRELGFELKKILKVLDRADFDKIIALQSHKKVLEKNLERTRNLITTIDKTVKHLKGTHKMKKEELYFGFSKEKQDAYENELIERFGDSIKTSIQESHQNIKNWSKEKWNSSNQEFDSLCKELTNLLNLAKDPTSKEAQALISKHYAWLKKFWVPTKDSYIGHSQLILESDLRKAYEAHHPNLPTFLAEGIKAFANKHLV